MLSPTEIDSTVRLFLLERYPEVQYSPRLYSTTVECANAVLLEERRELAMLLKTILPHIFLKEHLESLIIELETAD